MILTLVVLNATKKYSDSHAEDESHQEKQNTWKLILNMGKYMKKYIYFSAIHYHN